MQFYRWTAQLLYILLEGLSGYLSGSNGSNGSSGRRLGKLLGLSILVLGVGLWSTRGEARVYEPPLPRGLIGYPISQTFDAKVRAKIERILPNGVALLNIHLDAEGAAVMKLSTMPSFKGAVWQDYAPVVSNWRIVVQKAPVTVYAIFKRKNLTSAVNGSSTNGINNGRNRVRKGSTVSPIVHYTLDLKAPERVLERQANGYLDWSRHVLMVKRTHRATHVVRASRENSKNRGILNTRGTLFDLSQLEADAEAALKIDALRALETVRVTPGFTVGDLIYLGDHRQSFLRHYLSVLTLRDITYRTLPKSRRYVPNVSGLLPLESPSSSVNSSSSRSQSSAFLPLSESMSELMSESMNESMFQSPPLRTLGTLGISGTLDDMTNSQAALNGFSEDFLSANSAGRELTGIENVRQGAVLSENGGRSVIVTAMLSLLANPKEIKRRERRLVTFPTVYEHFKPHYAQEIKGAIRRKPFSAESYTGLVIDLRSLDYHPNLYPRVITADGRVVLTGNLYQGLKRASERTASINKQILTGTSDYAVTSVSNVPYVRYVRDLTTAAIPERTLFIKGSAIRAPLRDIVIENFYGDILLSDKEAREQMANGAFWIVLD